ncbi:hypothetical protein BU15DRAFT_68188 [Melanogaster broomeanus]|nr:hypothetical protein BU15DRAFT_68188 [Melanogaster broomeanus]
MSSRESSTDQPADSLQKPVEVLKIDEDGRCVGIDFFPDGNRLLGWNDQRMKVWTMEERASEVLVMESDTEILAAGVFPDGKRVLTGHERGGLKVWDCETGKILEVWNTDNEAPVKQHHAGIPIDANDGLYVVFSPNGDYVAIGGGKGQVSLWRPPGWDNLKSCQLPAVQPVQTRQSPDDLNVLDLPATPRPSVSRPSRADAAASRPTSTLTRLHVSWKSLWHSSHGDEPKVTPTHPGIAHNRHAAAEEAPRRSQLPANLPTTPGHYETFVIVAFTPPTNTRSLDDDPNEITAETTSHTAFCGLCLKLPFRRSKHPNHPDTHNSGVEMAAPRQTPTSYSTGMVYAAKKVGQNERSAQCNPDHALPDLASWATRPSAASLWSIATSSLTEQHVQKAVGCESRWVARGRLTTIGYVISEVAMALLLLV